MSTQATAAKTIIEICVSLARPGQAEAQPERYYYATSVEKARRIWAAELLAAGWQLNDYEVITQATSASRIGAGLQFDNYFSIHVNAARRCDLMVTFSREAWSEERAAAAKNTQQQLDAMEAAPVTAVPLAAPVAELSPNDSADRVNAIIEALPSNEMPRAYVETGFRGDWVNLAYYTCADHFHRAQGREVALTDFENVPRLLQAEFGGRELIFNYCQALLATNVHQREAFRAFIESQDSAEDLAEKCPTPQTLMALFDDKHRGYYGRPNGGTDQESLADYLEEMAADDEVFNAMPDKYRNYIDWMRAAQDCELRQELYAHNGHIFEF